MGIGRPVEVVKVLTCLDYYMTAADVSKTVRAQQLAMLTDPGGMPRANRFPNCDRNFLYIVATQVGVHG